MKHIVTGPMPKLLLACGTVAVAVLLALGLGGGVLAGPPLPPPPPGPAHPHRTPSPAEQDHATGGPFLSVDRAVQAALAVGAGAGVPISAQLQSVQQASAVLGFRAANNYVGDDRKVWLVIVDGPYKPSFGFAGQPRQFNRYSVVLDATTGRILGTGRAPVAVTPPRLRQRTVRRPYQTAKEGLVRSTMAICRPRQSPQLRVSSTCGRRSEISDGRQRSILAA